MQSDVKDYPTSRYKHRYKLAYWCWCLIVGLICWVTPVTTASALVQDKPYTLEQCEKDIETIVIRALMNEANLRRQLSECQSALIETATICVDEVKEKKVKGH